MGGIVVEVHVDHPAGRDLALDRVQEADELLVAVALHALADHGALEHVQRGESAAATCLAWRQSTGAPRARRLCYCPRWPVVRSPCRPEPARAHAFAGLG